MADAFLLPGGVFHFFKGGIDARGLQWRVEFYETRGKKQVEELTATVLYEGKASPTKSYRCSGCIHFKGM